MLMQFTSEEQPIIHVYQTLTLVGHSRRLQSLFLQQGDEAQITSGG
jgi:hypothetical protein